MEAEERIFNDPEYQRAQATYIEWIEQLQRAQTADDLDSLQYELLIDFGARQDAFSDVIPPKREEVKDEIRRLKDVRPFPREEMQQQQALRASVEHATVKGVKTPIPRWNRGFGTLHPSTSSSAASESASCARQSGRRGRTPSPSASSAPSAPNASTGSSSSTTDTSSESSAPMSSITTPSAHTAHSASAHLIPMRHQACSTPGEIRRRDRLGGLLHEYYRAAA